MSAADRYDAIFGTLEPPFAFVDLDAVRENAQRMLAAAAGTPIRIASKSVRSRGLLQRLLDLDPGFQGLLNLTLPEALWLHGHGFRDLVVAYPSVEPSALAALAALDPQTAPVIMVDSVAQLDLLPRGGGPLNVAIDLDVGFWPLGGRLKFGPKRSPLRTPEAAAALAAEITRRPNTQLVGVMAYEGQIAGVADSVPHRRLENAAIRVMKHYSARDVRERRAAMVAAVAAHAEDGRLRFVNGGGTGSIAQTVAEPAVSEVAAGSGFYAPMLFQYYRGFALQPAAGYALSLNRRPGPGVITALGGGYVASGATRADRQPVPAWPTGLKLDPLEGAGEAQTPLLGPAADGMAVGGRVYMRHAKAGELCERFNALYVIENGALAGELATYRGEGQAFL